MQNAEALAKDAPVLVMGQVQAITIDVHTRLISASDKELNTKVKVKVNEKFPKKLLE